MTAQELRASRLIGALFVERGLVSESQIRLALEIQEETDQPLGEILVERFGVSRAELAQVVAEQWQDTGKGSGTELQATLSENWKRIGEIFVTRGFVTEDELDRALARQRQTGERLGEALVGLGVITKFELAGALGEQMSTADAAASGEAPPAEVVQLRPEEQTPAGEEIVEADAPRETDEQPPEVTGLPVADQTAPAEPEEAEVAAETEPTEEVDVESEPAAEVETETETAKEHGLVAETAPPQLTLVPGHAWPEGDYVPPARPRPTLGASDTPGADASTLDLRSAACLAFLSTPAGYRLVPLAAPAEVGEVLELDGLGDIVVLRHAPSPLPGDERPCVVVEAGAQPLLYSFG